MTTREKGEMPQKTPLQKAYEEVLGSEVDTRTMRRIRNQYLKGEANLRTVKTLALLRRANGNVPLTIDDIERHQWLLDFAEGISGWVQGKDLLATLKKLNPCPCDRTIRNWGNQLGVPLRSEEWYSPDQVQVWIKKLARQTRFKMPETKTRSVS